MDFVEKDSSPSKRSNPSGKDDNKRVRSSAGSSRNNNNDEPMEGNEDLVFEDPFGDEFEEEDYNDNGDDDEDDEEAVERMARGEDGEEEEEVDEAPKHVWRPGIDKIEEGEELEYDPSAYIMYHSLRTEWPCLSFDILKDNLGENRQRYPFSMFVVTGSQADKQDKNKLTLLKLSDLHKTHASNDSDEEDNEDDDNVDEDPTLEHINIPHYGGVNRIRSMPQNAGIVCSLAETGQSHVYDLSAPLNSLMVRGAPRGQQVTKPVYTYKGHKTEGYALDWSPVTAGQIATGDNSGAIQIWKMESNSSSWSMEGGPFIGHRNSVEDIQWSPTEATVFSSCSSDKTIKIYDTRQKERNKAQISIDAHFEDINVMSWNRNVTYLLASGCDDGSFKVWDLRALRDKTKGEIAKFEFHKQPVTSIEWAPHDESVLCVSSADNQVTVWDLSVEEDADVSNGTGDILGGDLAKEFPAQLLFIHQGQYNVKEVHYHSQIPGLIMSTAEDGFNIFKPAISSSNN